MAAQEWFLGPRGNTYTHPHPPPSEASKDPIKGSRDRPRQVLLQHLGGSQGTHRGRQIPVS